MSDLILKWLNEEIVLSHRVSNFQLDFSNGFLFGELLNKFNQQLNFKEFKDSHERSHRLNNFNLLFPTMKTLGINYDHNIVNEIMQQKPQSALHTLYLLKMSLEKVVQQGSKSKANSLAPLKKIHNNKPQFDQLNQETFKLNLNRTNPAQKQINLHKHLQKFQERGRQHDQIIRSHHRRQEELKQQERTTFRTISLNNTKKLKEFSQKWEEKGLEDHQLNLEKKRRREESQQTFLNRKLQRQEQQKIRHQKSQQQDVKDQIQLFQQRVGKLEDPDDQIPLPDHQHVVKAYRTGMNDHSAIINTKKLREKEEMVGNDRSKRRRKMIVDQNKHQIELDIRKREESIFEKLQQQSRQQKQIDYQIWRAFQQKNIIIYDRKLRDSRYQVQKDLSLLESQRKERALLQALRVEFKEDVAQKQVWMRELEIQEKVLVRKQNYTKCKKLVEEFLILTDICYQHLQTNNSNQIESRFLNQELRLFVHAETLISENEMPLSSLQKLAERQLQDYLQASHRWEFTPEIKDEPTDAQQENAIPQKAVNNYTFGNLLYSIYERLYPSIPVPEVASDPNSLVVCISGLAFSGRKTLSHRLAQDFGMKVIEVDKLLQSKLQQSISSCSEELRVAVQSGQKISNKLISELILSQIKKGGSFIIQDYPKTESQAEELLRNISPWLFPKQTEFQRLTAVLSKVVKFNPPVIIPLAKRPCGIDYMIWIHISKEEALRRCMGKRMNSKGEVVHLMEVTGANDLTRLPDESVRTIQQNAFKISHVPTIRQYFQQFGFHAPKFHSTPNKMKLEESLAKISERAESEESSQQKLTQTLVWQVLSGRESEQSCLQECREAMQRLVQIKKFMKGNEQSRVEEQKKRQEQKEREQKAVQTQLKRFCLTSKSQLEALIDKIELRSKNQRLVEKEITLLWEHLEHKYLTTAQRAFLQVRVQRQAINQRFATVRKRFIQLLIRHDSKFYLIKEFQIKYNQFYDSNKDMFEQEYLKEEMHHRVEDLQDRLSVLIEARKQQASEERRQIVKSGWIQGQLQRFFLYVLSLLQNELDYFLTTQQLINDYFLIRDARDFKEAPSLQLLQVPNDQTLQIVNGEDAPRLEKAISEAMRMFNQEESQTVQDKGKKGGKGAPAKKDDKKGAKKEEEKKELSANQQQAKRITNIQKSIFRYRVQMIRNFGRSRLREMTKLSQDLNNLLEDLQNYTFRCENEAVSEACLIIRKAIQQETKIQKEIQLNYVDVVVSKKTLNFFTPQPTILPAKQLHRPDRFTVSKLKSIIAQIGGLANSSGFIDNQTLYSFFIRKHNTIFGLEDLPLSWRVHKPQHYKQLLANVDRELTGQCHRLNLIPYIVLSSCRIPQHQELKAYIAKFKQKISKSDFLNRKCWFDAQENDPPEPNSNPFDRARLLREELFGELSSEEEVSRSRLQRVLGVEGSGSYYSVLFG